MKKIKQGLDGNDPEVFAAVLTESVQKSLEKEQIWKSCYCKRIRGKKDNSGKYGLLDTEMNKLEARCSQQNKNEWKAIRGKKTGSFLLNSKTRKLVKKLL